MGDFLRPKNASTLRILHIISRARRQTDWSDWYAIYKKNSVHHHYWYLKKSNVGWGPVVVSVTEIVAETCQRRASLRPVH